MRIDRLHKGLELRVLIAPQAFKGSLSAKEAATAIAQGVLSVFPAAKLTIVPMADGGDGTLQTLIESVGGEYFETPVSGPVGEKLNAIWGVLGDRETVIIETATICGLVLTPLAFRDPSRTTTRGVGELIRHILDQGYRQFIVGLGGTATNDGGIGLAQALGVRMLDRYGNEIKPGGRSLHALRRIDRTDLDIRVAASSFIGAVDVTNLLCGPKGAAMVYGPQKGADPEMCVFLDRGLSRLAHIIYRDLGQDVRQLVGGGAGGGLAAGLVAFLGGRLQSGSDLVSKFVRLDNDLAGVDLVIVGEGSLDGQTVFGKSVITVAHCAKQREIPVLAIVGSVGEGYEEVFNHGITWIRAIIDDKIDLNEAMEKGAFSLKRATEQGLRDVLFGEGC